MHICREKFIFGALYLAFTRYYNYSSHDHRLQEQNFYHEFQAFLVVRNFHLLEDFVDLSGDEEGDYTLL